MLKTRVGDVIWLVEQPDHARVSGYLVAHWGDAGGFARPGHYPGAVHSDRWRDEVILAIAQHDNGWWEWEAMPVIDSADGWPMNLTDVASQSPDEGFRRWQLGIPRLAERHPYAALLISLHAYWLYAFAFNDLAADGEDAYRHPLFSSGGDVIDLVVERELTRQFLEGQRALQDRLLGAVKRDTELAPAAVKEHLFGHLKLLQLMDALSLLLAFNDPQERELVNIPKSGWQDRVTMTWNPAGGHRVVCEPYPFDADPLPVCMPARVVRSEDAVGAPLARLYRSPVQTLSFELASKR